MPGSMDQSPIRSLGLRVAFLRPLCLRYASSGQVCCESTVLLYSPDIACKNVCSLPSRSYQQSHEQICGISSNFEKRAATMVPYIPVYRSRTVIWNEKEQPEIAPVGVSENSK